MAEAKKKRVLKKPESVREKATKQTEAKPKSHRLKSATGKVKRPFRAVRRLGQKEYHPVKLPDNKAGRFMTKRRSFIPRYFREAWGELRLVTWPNRRETLKLTLAVFIFAITFGIMIAVVDYGLDKAFRQLLLN